MQFQQQASIVPAGAPSAPMTGRLVGEVIHFAGPVAPPGWLACNGQAVSRTTYVNLFNVLGTTYGAGDGSTTFNIPNTAARVMIAPGTFANTYAFGASGGEELHTLANGEMPQHNHASPTGTESAWHQHGVSDPGHGHYTNTRDYAYGNNPASGGDYVALGAAATTFRANSDSRAVTAGGTGVGIGNQSALHTHGIALDGGSGGHNNMQPYIVFQTLIYAGA